MKQENVSLEILMAVLVKIPVSRNVTSYKLVQAFVGQDSVDDTVTRLRGGRPRNLRSIPCRSKRVFSSPQHPDQPTLPSVRWVPSPGVKKRPEREAHHLVLRFRMRGTIPALSCMLSWPTQEKLYQRCERFRGASFFHHQGNVLEYPEGGGRKLL